MTEQPCVKTAHNGWLDIFPVRRVLHDLERMLAEAQTDDQRTAIEAALAAVDGILLTIKERHDDG